MHNPHYPDVYHKGGQPEKHHVFVAGNHLPARFATLQPGENFIVAELGFGLGLAFAATCACWQITAPKGANLTFISCENHPVKAENLVDIPALRTFWQSLQPGWNTCVFEGNLTLHLFVGDAAEAVQTLPQIPVHAWFLDGHDPKINPDMWAEPLLQSVFARTLPGGTASTYTAAGHIRRSLKAVGFHATRTRGYGTKWHMTQASRPL